MLRIATKTKLSPEEVIKRAMEFFSSGYGLKVVEHTPTSTYFEGSGGGVDVTTCAEEKMTSVELVSREWDYQVKEFISNMKK